MCGIAGYFAREPIERHEGHALLSRMMTALTHRGPDGLGVHVDSHCGIGCTRLAIVDVERGHMPIFNEDGHIACVMNGEIYNYQPLRRALHHRGHRLTNRSDSEVIPHLYEDCGLGLVPHLTGMFAFALWDAREQRLLLARDRFGIKPLFVARANGVVLFASEVKALLATRRLDARIDIRALMDVGTAGYPMPPRTMFRDIESLLPGTTRSFSVRGAETHERYFSVPYPVVTSGPAVPAPAAPDAVDRMRDLFDQVVEDHLMGDVAVGGLVSGGIDSVSVAMRASALSAQPLSTFAMTFEGGDSRFDESDHSDAASQAMGSQHRRVPQGPIDEAEYRGTIRAMEAPQLSAIPVCLYRLARAVRESGLKVVLTGEGADETFAGYQSFKKAKTRRTQTAQHRASARAEAASRLDRELYRILSGWWRVEPEAVGRYGLLPPSGERWWMLADTWATALDAAVRDALPVPGSVEILPERPRSFECEDIAEPLHGDLLFEQQSRLDGWVLVMGDRLMMAHSVEGRVPFLDHRLVELTAQVDPELLLWGSREKHLLREAMTGRIPEPIRQRTKQGFNAPPHEWLFGPSSPAFVREALSPEAVRRVGVFDSQGLQRLETQLAATESGFRRRNAGCTLNIALSLQILAEEFGATL